jgi:hypothetical protein
MAMPPERNRGKHAPEGKVGKGRSPTSPPRASTTTLCRDPSHQPPRVPSAQSGGGGERRWCCFRRSSPRRCARSSAGVLATGRGSPADGALHLCLLLAPRRLSSTGAGTSSPSPSNRGAFRREEKVRHLPPLAAPLATAPARSARLGDEDRPCSIRRPPHRRRGGAV